MSKVTPGRGTFRSSLDRWPSTVASISHNAHGAEGPANVPTRRVELAQNTPTFVVVDKTGIMALHPRRL